MNRTGAAIVYSASLAARASLSGCASLSSISLGAICQNWANALCGVAQLDRARETFLRSAAAHCRAGSPRVLVVMSENEALRVDVMQGRAAATLPAIEAKLAELRSW